MLRSAALMLCVTAIAVSTGGGHDRSGAASVLAKVTGAGSTHMGLAMQYWNEVGPVPGLMSYLPSGTDAALSQFGQGLIDYVGADYETQTDSIAQRGFQYVPAIGDAEAVLYNASDVAGSRVENLHLRRETVARIFIGDITSWADPAIKADNLALQLPDNPITVVYPAGPAGSTAFFYDFVQHTIPAKFTAWATTHGLSTTSRNVQLPYGFAPHTVALGGADQIAQYAASDQGRWSIAYDEFSYARAYSATSAWVQNESGAYVQPDAAAVSIALKSARVRPDTSEDLTAVYTSSDPVAYPISNYHYLVTQCATTTDVASCKGSYLDQSVTETLARFLRYVACDGTGLLARIGYAPLPGNLAQDVADAIGRLRGAPPEQLNSDNCANPMLPPVGPTTTAPPTTTTPTASTTTTTTTRPTEPPSQSGPPADPPPGPAALNVSPTTIPPGGTFHIDSHGWAAATMVSVVLHSDPIALGTLTADASGTVDGQLTIPVDVAPGLHTLSLTGTSAAGTARTVTVTVTVAQPTAAAPAPGRTSPLARTGTDSWRYLFTGSSLLGAGALLVIAANRQRSRLPTTNR